tara:strand:+ start:837 stop:989 length:153 start_codon:yes stop_codon:yes gene_type:complete
MPAIVIAWYGMLINIANWNIFEGSRFEKSFLDDKEELLKSNDLGTIHQMR